MNFLYKFLSIFLFFAGISLLFSHLLISFSGNVSIEIITETGPLSAYTAVSKDPVFQNHFITGGLL